MTAVLLIALGASVGANARYFLSAWAIERWGSAFPYGTLLINVLGSLGIGIVLELAALRPGVTLAWRLLLVTGLLGGFTTFSTFSYETFTLLTKGNLAGAAVYAFGSLALGLAAAALGVALARLIA